MSENKDLQEMIEKAVEKSVRKETRKSKLTSLIIPLIGYALILCGLWYIYNMVKPKTPEITPVADQDLTLENHGILGFKAADFEEPILGKSEQQSLLIVDEQEVSVNSVITQAGLFNWAITSKTLNETIYGTGIYTVDLSKVRRSSIEFDEEQFTVYVHIPYPELHEVTFDPEKTVLGDVQRGWLAFGEVTMTAEQQKTFEIEAKNKLTARLNEQDSFERAVKFAKLSAYELYQPVVSAVSPAYKVAIIIDDPE